MSSWSVKNIPPQHGRSVIITGASGLGYETALALAAAGADIVLAGRSATKGAASVAGIQAAIPDATIVFEILDLADLDSVAAFSQRMLARRDRLDVLINNAGVMTPPSRHVTSQGFELQFGTNYLGHFALTRHLLPLLQKGREARVVSLSSGAHRLQAAIHFDDLQWQKTYKPWQAYAQSKLAMLLFAFELQRRSDANGWGLMSTAAHPGYARTGLQSAGPAMGRTRPSLADYVSKLIEPFASQSAADGALPTVFAAVSPDAKPAGYYGPQGFAELKGAVGPARIGKQANDRVLASRLWDVTEQLTGMTWPGRTGTGLQANGLLAA